MYQVLESSMKSSSGPRDERDGQDPQGQEDRQGHREDAHQRGQKNNQLRRDEIVF